MEKKNLQINMNCSIQKRSINKHLTTDEIIGRVSHGLLQQLIYPAKFLNQEHSDLAKETEDKLLLVIEVESFSSDKEKL